MNMMAVDKGVNAIVPVTVPADWADAVDAPVAETQEIPEYVQNICRPINAQKAMIYRLAPSWATKTVRYRPVRLLMKNAA